MSSNSINSGMISQLITNSQSNDFQNTFNYSVGNQMIDFDANHTLTLSRDYDSVVPQYIVIRLHPNDSPNLTASEHIHNICRLFSKIRLIMQVSDQTILQFPLSLLHALSPAKLHYDNLYIKIPFSALFNQINVVGLYHSNVTFVIKDFNEIVNYASYCSLVTRVYMHNIEERNNMTSAHSRNFIQQIGTLHVTNNTNNGRNYQIKTNILNGPTKGLLIQCNILDLQSIKFYINDLLRFDYNHFFILTACVKLSEKLLYLPFNDCIDFLDRGANTFAGAINLSGLQNSTLCLHFSRDQPEIVIHNVYFNYFRQVNGLGGLHVDNIPFFVSSTTEDHPIQPIVGISPNASLLDMSGNYIQPTQIIGLMSGSTGPHFYPSSPLSHISPYQSHLYPSQPPLYPSHLSLTGPSDLTGYPIPNGYTEYRIINPNRNTCNITHEDIIESQRYMTCSNCENNYAEYAIKQWLRHRTGNLRTCPTCREIWTNFNVYINSTEADEYIYSMPE